MKKSEFLKIVREEVHKGLREFYGPGEYFAPAGFGEMGRAPEKRVQRYDNLERWKIVAMQIGAVVQDRFEDFVAVMPDQTKIGTFNKLTQSGTLNLLN
jgi:hypothetical protein